MEQFTNGLEDGPKSAKWIRHPCEQMTVVSAVSAQGDTKLPRVWFAERNLVKNGPPGSGRGEGMSCHRWRLGAGGFVFFFTKLFIGVKATRTVTNPNIVAVIS